jgi:N-acetylmuramoyl-L-alanine amidase
MGLTNTKHTRWLRHGNVAVLCCAMALAAHPYASASQRRSPGLTPWEQAERGREALEAIPEGTRTRADFTRAMDGFRIIYHDSPGDMHAPASVNAVAELLTEQGRTFHDARALKAAVGQYEFLRTQYPGSSLRVAALLAEAQIYENDLADPASAREKYLLLVKQYPRSSQAEEARAGLASLDSSRSAATTTRPDRPQPKPSDQPATTFAPMPTTWNAAAAPVQDKTATAATPETDRRGTSSPVDETLEAQSVTPPPPTPATVSKPVVRRHGQLAQVTGIRHWSTPNYTRVAIDLGDDVTYEAARVPNPDRIYFDLHGTRLAQDLIGKSFAVTDDGFLRKIRAAQFSNDMTRVVLDVNDVTEYSAFLLPNPYRLIIDIHGGSKTQAPVPTTTDLPAQKPATAAPSVPNTTALKSTTQKEVASLSEQPGRVEATTKPTSQPIAAVVPGKKEQETPSSDLKSETPDSTIAPVPASSAAPSKKTKKGKPAKDSDASSAVPARPAVPTADGETSLVRALGLKVGRIVIDAGHGGHDSGTLGVDGLEEKDVVLDVALRLGKILHDRLGAEIIYTRSDDTFIPLETRTAIANKAQADLFLSIHANSSVDASARGVETYYLNFTSQADALEVAARENAVSDQSIHQLSDLVKKIALKDKIDESREFATDVEQSLYGGLQKGNSGLKDRGVKKAPFVVLIGANMPSILAEISFVTNPKDANQLRQPDYRQRVAESLYKGVAKYAGGLSSTHTPTERASGR